MPGRIADRRIAVNQLRLRGLTIAMLFALTASTAHAGNKWGEEDPNPGEFGLSLGAGTWNCGHWLSSPETEKEGRSWILGWWSATNASNARNHFVGGKIGSSGILGRVRARCTQQPAMALSNAAGMAYFEIGRSGKMPGK